MKILVAGLPGNLPAALFIVLHTSASFPGTFPEILSRSGPLPARHAAEGMRIEQRKISVAPSDHHLVIEQGHLHLSIGPKECFVRPSVDVLFRSAAATYGSRVIGIILTGTGHDGTAGLLAIQLQGGVTIVQNPEEAYFPSLPQSARKQIQVDYISSLENLASLLVFLTQTGTQPLLHNAEK